MGAEEVVFHSSQYDRPRRGTGGTGAAAETERGSADAQRALGGTAAGRDGQRTRYVLTSASIFYILGDQRPSLTVLNTIINRSAATSTPDTHINRGSQLSDEGAPSPFCTSRAGPETQSPETKLSDGHLAARRGPEVPETGARPPPAAGTRTGRNIVRDAEGASGCRGQATGITPPPSHDLSNGSVTPELMSVSSTEDMKRGWED